MCTCTHGHIQLYFFTSLLCLKGATCFRQLLPIHGAGYCIWLLNASGRLISYIGKLSLSASSTTTWCLPMVSRPYFKTSRRCPAINAASSMLPYCNALSLRGVSGIYLKLHVPSNTRFVDYFFCWIIGIVRLGVVGSLVTRLAHEN